MVVVLAAVAMAGPGGDERLAKLLEHMRREACAVIGDLDDRERWDAFQYAYEILLSRCSTAHAPWHVIPADRKWARNTAIARIVRNTLREMAPAYPEPVWKPQDYVVR